MICCFCCFDNNSYAVACAEIILVGGGAVFQNNLNILMTFFKSTNLIFGALLNHYEDPVLSGLQANFSKKKNRQKRRFWALFENVWPKNCIFSAPHVLLGPQKPLETFWGWSAKMDVVKLYQRGTLGKIWQPELRGEVVAPPPLSTLLLL